MQTIRLTVPAEPAYARSVRMMAANLAVLGEMTVDDIEDMRMAAEEGFIRACATEPETMEIAFAVERGALSIDFALGSAEPEPSQERDLAELLLAAVCDEYRIEGASLHLSKKAVAADVD